MAHEIEISSFPILFDESEEAILSRLLDPFAQQSDPAQRFDVAEGSFLYDLFEPIGLEFLRQYERLNQIAAVCFIRGAYGSYLDSHGEQLRLPRQAARFADITLTIEGETGTVIPYGTRYTTPSSGDEEEEQAEFATLAAVTIPAAGTVAVNARATVAGAAGNVAARTVTQPVDVILGVISITNENPALGGANVEDDDGYRGRLVEALQAAPGAGNARDYDVWAKEVSGVEESVVFPLWAGAGTVKVVVFGPGRTIVPVSVLKDAQSYIDPSVVLISAFDPGELWQGGVLTANTKEEGSTGLTLTVPASSIYDAEAALSVNLSGIATADVFRVWVSVGAGRANIGNIRIFLEDASAREAVREVAGSALVDGAQVLTWQLVDMTVAPGFTWASVAKVRVEVTTLAGGSATVTFDTLRYRDADGGLGQGQAPVGAQVTVTSARALGLTITASVTPLSGWALAQLVPLITERLEAYFAERDSKRTYVYLSEIANVINDTEGVLTYANITINGAAADLPVAAEELPVLTEFTAS